MDDAEIIMVMMNYNVGNLENSVNHMSYMLAKFMRKMKQTQDSTNVVEDTNLSNPMKLFYSPGVSQAVLNIITLKKIRLVIV